jgi:hypothetical protein
VGTGERRRNAHATVINTFDEVSQYSHSSHSQVDIPIEILFDRVYLLCTTVSPVLNITWPGYRRKRQAVVGTQVIGDVRLNKLPFSYCDENLFP